MCNRHINCSTLKCHAQVFLHIICHHMLRTVLWNYYIRREESISWRRRMHLLARYTVTHTVQHIWSCIHSNTCTTIIIYMHDKWLYYFICTPAQCNTSHASALQSLNIGVRHDYSTQSILHDHVHSTLILSCKLAHNVQYKEKLGSVIAIYQWQYGPFVNGTQCACMQWCSRSGKVIVGGVLSIVRTSWCGFACGWHIYYLQNYVGCMIM